MMILTFTPTPAGTPLLDRLAAQAVRDYRRGEPGTFTRYCRQLQGPVLRAFTRRYYELLGTGQDTQGAR